MPVGLLHLRYVVEVARTGSFSAAARRLAVSQASVSQQVLAAERALGVVLFERHPRGATPTAAGESFVQDARATLEAFDATLARADRHARGEVGTVHVGFTTAAALELTPIVLNRFARRFPDVDVRLREFPLTDPSAGLEDGSTHVAFIRPPIATPGLWLEPLLEEPRAVAVADAHPLAGRTSVSVHDLLDEPMIATAGGDPVWEAFWLLDEHRQGAPPLIAAHADTHEAELQIVASGRAVSVTCAAGARFYARPGVTVVPIRDVAPSTVALARRAGDPNPLVRRFVEVVREVVSPG